MAETNPISWAYGLLVAQLSGFAGLLALKPPVRLQFYDRIEDIRGALDRNVDFSGWLMVVPLPSPTDFYATSSTVRYDERYAIGYGVGSAALATIQAMRYQVTKALGLLAAKLGPTGAAIVVPSDLVLDWGVIGGSDPQREPIADPTRWSDICEIAIKISQQRSTLLSLDDGEE